jgi:hypothetical protein
MVMLMRRKKSYLSSSRPNIAAENIAQNQSSSVGQQYNASPMQQV